MAPPSAALEHASFDVAGGVKPFTSDTSEIKVPQTLMLAYFVAILVYNIAFFFDIDVPRIINFCAPVYQALIRFASFTHRLVCNAQALGFRLSLVRIHIASRDWLASVYRSRMNAHALRRGFERMISNSSEHLGQIILVDAITVPSAGTLALIQGLPADVSAAELRRYLESILFIQYSQQLNSDHAVHRTVERAINSSVPADAEDTSIDTSSPGLWNGTCTRSSNAALGAPDVHTPTSEASAKSLSTSEDTPSASISGSSVSVDLSPASSSQRRSYSRRA